MKVPFAVLGRVSLALTLSAQIVVFPVLSYAAGPQLKPIAPPVLEQPPPPESRDMFHCSRQFAYGGKTFDCDSFVKQDAEGLRPIIQDVPPAVSELDIYQRNRERVRTTAYFGSAGLALALGCLILSKTSSDPSTVTTIQDVGIGGIALAGVSLIFGLSIMQTNEVHLDNAVKAYNVARPSTPIELKFTAGFEL